MILDKLSKAFVGAFEALESALANYSPFRQVDDRVSFRKKLQIVGDKYHDFGFEVLLDSVLEDVSTNESESNMLEEIVFGKYQKNKRCVIITTFSESEQGEKKEDLVKRLCSWNFL